MDSNKKDLKVGDDLVPTWSIGAYIYTTFPGAGSTYDLTTWLTSVQGLITAYNTAQTNAANKISTLYVYGSDLELPWVQYASGCNPSGISYCMDPGTFGFYFNDANGNMPLAITTMNKYMDTNLGNTTAPSQMVAIVDGRIDNGYLQDLFPSNQTLCNATYMEWLAELVVTGNNTKTSFTPAPVPIPKDLGNQLGISHFSETVNGIQFDLEPFNSASSLQVAFYQKAGELLASNSQYYSIFTFPKEMNQATADMLGTNGYVVISLYDLADLCTIDASCTSDYTNTAGICDVSNTPPPLTAVPGPTIPGPKGSTCTPNTVTPTYTVSQHSTIGYTNAAYLAVRQTIALANQYKIKYKFAVPLSASVHEFENWGYYTGCTFSDAKPVNAKNCAMGQPQIASSSILQTDYLNQVILAISHGIEDSHATYDSTLFRGIDFYEFAPYSIWTPTPPVVDYSSGVVYYGNLDAGVDIDDCCFQDSYSSINIPYIYTSPAYPTSATIETLAEYLKNFTPNP